jgi:hypothetical protein
VVVESDAADRAPAADPESELDPVPQPGGQRDEEAFRQVRDIDGLDRFRPPWIRQQIDQQLMCDRIERRAIVVGAERQQILHRQRPQLGRLIQRALLRPQPMRVVLGQRPEVEILAASDEQVDDEAATLRKATVRFPTGKAPLASSRRQPS